MATSNPSINQPPVESQNPYFYLPPGIRVKFNGTTVPPGWVRASGDRVKKVDYPRIFLALGSATTSDASTLDSFTLPTDTDYIIKT